MKMGSLTLTSFPHHKVVFPGRSLHANETPCLALQNMYKGPSAGAGGRWSEGPILAFPPCPRPAPTTTGYFQPVWVSRCFLASLSAYFCFPIHAIPSITHRHSHLSALDTHTPIWIFRTTLFPLLAAFSSWSFAPGRALSLQLQSPGDLGRM